MSSRSEEPRRTRTLVVSVVGALALHGAIGFALTLAPERAARIVSLVPTAETAEIDLLDPPTTPAPEVPSPEPGPLAERTAASDRARDPEATPTPPMASAAPDADGSPSSSTPTVVALVAPPAVTLGLSGIGANPFLVPGALPEPAPRQQHASTSNGATPAAPSRAEASKRAADALREGMQHRSSVGVGPEGPVLTALNDATTSGFAPVVGGATFLAIVDDKGFVRDVRIVAQWPKSKDAAAGWDDVRERAAAALRGKKLPGVWRGTDGHGPGGAELRLRVESDLRMPSGSRPIDPAVKPGLKDAPPIQLSGNLPGAGLPSDSVKSYEVGRFDLTDIKAKPQRVVHAWLVASNEL